LLLSARERASARKGLSRSARREEPNSKKLALADQRRKASAFLQHLEGFRGGPAEAASGIHPEDRLEVAPRLGTLV
jgi:hypothetical protein